MDSGPYVYRTRLQFSFIKVWMNLPLNLLPPLRQPLESAPLTQQGANAWLNIGTTKIVSKILREGKWANQNRRDWVGRIESYHAY